MVELVHILKLRFENKFSSFVKSSECLTMQKLQIHLAETISGRKKAQCRPIQITCNTPISRYVSVLERDNCPEYYDKHKKWSCAELNMKTELNFSDYCNPTHLENPDYFSLFFLMKFNLLLLC